MPHEKQELEQARAKRLAEIVADITASTPRPPEMAEAVFTSMIARMAMHQLVDEELRPERPADA
ncbi:MAG: hypothetical protein ABIT20_09340 [Gemmatimonadaceae bacterium]